MCETTNQLWKRQRDDLTKGSGGVLNNGPMEPMARPPFSAHETLASI